MRVRWMCFCRVLLAMMMALSVSVSRGLELQHQGQSENARAAALLADGQRLLAQKNVTGSMPYFDKVIAIYQAKHANKNVKYLSARDSAESLYYLLQAAADDSRRKTVVTSSNWSEAHYLKAYALIELGRHAEAATELDRAVTLSPQNSLYLSERGALYQMEKNWAQALKSFELAVSAAEFSPSRKKNAELGRAWRGLAYTYVELEQIDDAEAVLQKCIELDPNDQKARKELDYIGSLRVKPQP